MADTISEAEIRILLSKNLKRLRRKQHLSQMALASKADLTHNFINDIENGKKWLSPETLAKLSAALETEPYQFFISRTKISDQEADVLAIHLDDLSDTFLKMVQDIKGRYLQDTPDED
jgi:transcriptional regulator with XRE-family HTH domain